jgi:hypothetical protein
MKFTVYVKVVMPDGSIGSFPALRYYPSDDGKNPAVAATFDTRNEASCFAQPAKKRDWFVKLRTVMWKIYHEKTLWNFIFLGRIQKITTTKRKQILKCIP